MSSRLPVSPLCCPPPPLLSVRVHSQFPRQMTTPVRLLLTTQSDQTSKYTTSVSGCPDDDPHLTLCLWGKKELSFIPLGALRKFGLNNELLKRDTAGEATSALFKSVCGRTNLNLYIIFIQVGHRREWRTTRFSHTRPWGQRSGQRSGHSKNARLRGALLAGANVDRCPPVPESHLTVEVKLQGRVREQD